MVLLISVLYTLLAFLGFRDHPDSPTTELAGAVSCSGLAVSNGQVTCSTDVRKTVCQVVCDRKYQGRFTCTEDEGWSPKLPKCAKPIEGSAADGEDEPLVEVSCDGTTAGEFSCALACRRVRKRGRCVGSRCECY